MRKLLIIVITLSVFGGALVWIVAGPRRAGGRDLPAIASESTARYLAVVKPMPVYPGEALRAAVQGVVVASVLVGVSGSVERVTILESPDISTARAVREALSGWHLRRWEGAKPHTKLQSTLTFYFRIANGHGRVLSPEDLGARRTLPSVRPGTWLQPQPAAAVSPQNHGPGS